MNIEQLKNDLKQALQNIPHDLKVTAIQIFVIEHIDIFNKLCEEELVEIAKTIPTEKENKGGYKPVIYQAIKLSDYVKIIKHI